MALRFFLCRRQGAFRLSWLVLVLGAVGGAAQAEEDANPYLHRFDPKTRSVRFELRDHLQHPHFTWPRTLLGYRVDFTGADVRPEQLRVLDEITGAEVPFQLAQSRPDHGQLLSATVNLIGDFPTGSVRAWTLRAEAAGPKTWSVVKVQDNGGVLILDTGKMQARVPKSQRFAVGAKVPGPVLSLQDGRGWMGDSELVSEGKVVRSLQAKVVEQGPLFATVRLTYEFDGGATYVAEIKAIAGSDFVEFSEHAEGLSRADRVRVEQTWTGFRPTLREGAPITPQTIYYRGEDPAFVGPPRTENLAEDFYYFLAPNTPDGTVSRQSASFAEAESGRGLGVSVLGSANWDDCEYAIWASGSALAVHFRDVNGTLHWRWPVVAGTRKTALVCYDEKAVPGENYPHFVSNWQGGLSLDRVKDWRLTYPDSARLPGALPHAASGQQPATLAKYLEALWQSSLVKVEGGWVHPVTLREMHYWVVPGFAKWRAQMTPAERERATALLLFTSYAAAREEVSPLRTMLGGHPNFMADWKYPLAAGAFLFPAHPLAREWADEFEKFLELSSVFYVRPDVPAWQARGGRWTESLGIYNFAFLDPAGLANRLAEGFDGRNRFAFPGYAEHAEYLTGVVSAPIKFGTEATAKASGPLTLENGFERSLPPQGAHGGRRPVPASADQLGENLLRFRPLAAEHLLWTAARGTDVPNRGTNPRLTSAKFTGYGCVLRAAVDTPEEVAIILQQIDKGPNYRWGFGNEGGCGDLYFYASGLSFTGHQGEDAGDRRVTDADLTCNTGVYKDSTFRGIGMDELTEPLRNLEVAQMAELHARTGADAYAGPEYARREVLLVGSDYFVTFDELNDNSRVAWSTVDGEDVPPKIIPLTGENAHYLLTSMSGSHHENATLQRWDCYKGAGDRTMLVTHKNEIKLLPKRRGEKSPAHEIATSGGEDFLVLQRAPVTFASDGFTFEGAAGVLRKRADGSTELALFQGTKIGAGDFVMETLTPGLSIGVTLKKDAPIAGALQAPTAGAVTFRGGAAAANGVRFYLDGAPLESTNTDGKLFCNIPAGAHRWELTGGDAEPMPPAILRTENHRAGARVFVDPVIGAERYRIEISHNVGMTWTPAGETSGDVFDLQNVPMGKVHVRAIARHGARESRPGKDYPIYVSNEPPLPPDGVRCALSEGAVQLSWGEVLGVREYRALRRERCEASWKEIFRGRANVFCDVAPGIVAADHEPGLEAAAGRAAQPAKIYEYAVTAVNDLGESAPSAVADTDPASWRNWEPATELRFKRRSTYWQPPYVRVDQVPPEYYPN